MKFASLVITPDATVREAIARIDSGGKQFVLVVQHGKLVGVVTDGDVRRGLLRGVGLQSSVAEVVNPRPATVHADADEDEVDEIRNRLGVRYVPVVDASGALLDLIGPDEHVSVALTTPVVLMAGGRGTRLYPLTKDTPKPMVPVGGVPMIELIIRRVRAQGFRRVFVSVNYLGHSIEEHLGDGSSFGLEIEYLRESSPLGTAGALAQLVGRVTEPCIVMNADLMTKVDLRQMLNFHRKSLNCGTMGVRDYTFEIPFGVVRLAGEVVEALTEKPQHREVISAGISVLDPIALDLLKREEYCDMPTLLSRIIESGHSVGAFHIHEDWMDVGNPEDLAKAREAVEGSEP